MPRDHARVNLSLWQDDDFRDLPPAAQHLYFLLWTHPELSYAGVVDWRPGRLAALAAGWGRAQVNAAADCLEQRLFIVRDIETEECLIRSWVRFDGLTKSPQMAVSFANAYAATASPIIRGVLVHEANKLRDLEPDNAGWAKPQVLEVLSKRSIDPRSRDLPADPLAPGVGDGLGGQVAPPLGDRSAGSSPWASPSVSTPPTPSPAPTPFTPPANSSESGDGGSAKSKRATQQPKNWIPNEKHREYATQNGIDIGHEAAQFSSHHQAKGSTFKSWDAAFRTWLGNASKWQKERGNVHQLAPRLDGSDAGIDEWVDERMAYWQPDEMPDEIRTLEQRRQWIADRREARRAELADERREQLGRTGS